MTALRVLGYAAVTALEGAGIAMVCDHLRVGLAITASCVIASGILTWWIGGPLVAADDC